MTERRKANLGLAGAVLALTTAAAPLLAQSDVPENRILRVVPYADLQSLDPIVTTVGIVQRHATMVYDVLFARDADQTPKPQMVESWDESNDGLTWTFVLRDDLAFHDGAPVTADDVVASMTRWAAKDSFGQQIWARTDSLTASDEKTVVWTLDEPYGLMLYALSKPSGIMPAIMPKRLAETPADTAVTEVIGSGPFEFVADEWVPGSMVVYEKNEDYVPRDEPPNGASGGKVVNVDRVEWLNIRDQQSAILALQNGEVDYLEAPGTDFLPILEGAGMQTQRTDTLGSQGMIRMNHIHPPFDDVRARRALLYLVNQDQFLQTMFSDPELYETCGAFFVCGAPLASDAGVEDTFGNDPERARELFAEAGYDGEPIVILHPTDVQTMNSSTLVLAEALRSIDVAVDLQTLDYAAMSGRRSNRAAPSEGGWHIGLTYWPGLLISDPVGNTPLQASCDDAWAGWPCNEEMQALIDSFPDAATTEERQALADEIQVMAYEDVVPYVPFGQWFVPVAYSPKLEGVIGMPGTMILWNISKSE